MATRSTLIWIVFVPENRTCAARWIWSDAASCVISLTAIGYSGDGWIAGGAIEHVPQGDSNRIASLRFGDGPA